MTAHPVTLLAIDDDLQDLEIVREAFSEPSFRIITAQAPEEGFEAFVRVRPRIVLMRLEAQPVSGMELLERMLGIDPGSPPWRRSTRVPVIM